MDAIEAILNRRSIRKYTNKRISDKIIKQLLETAFNAPSARNLQPWHFFIIDDHNILDKIPEFHRYAGMLREANKAILVCGDLDLENNIGYLTLDCSAATENLLIAANAMGLGSCWIGIYPIEERITNITKLLCLPEHIIPISLISLGFPLEEIRSEKRYNKDRIHFNIW